MSSQIKVIRETRLDPNFPLSRHELIELVLLILDSLELSGDSFSIKLVDDREITRLNEKYMGCSGPTNILSFPARGESESGDSDIIVGDEGDLEQDSFVFIGELALSVDALSREAGLYGQPPVAHLARLLAHGILHLAGYDHSDVMYDLTDAAVDRVLLEYADARGRE